MKTFIPPESEEQEKVFRWAEFSERQYPELELLNGSMNGAKRSIFQANLAKRQGLKAGFPDISLYVSRGGYHGLFIEMKRIKKGRVSEDQKRILRSLKNQGYFACVCKGGDAAITVIEKYLGGEYERRPTPDNP
jgi:hypothetical protein